MKKFSEWSLGAKTTVGVFVFIPVTACLAFLLDGTSLMPLVSAFFLFGWLVFVF